MQTLWKTVWRFLKKSKNRATVWYSNPTPGHIIRKDPRMFTAALSITAKTCKQPNCPLADEWTAKMWYLHTKEYFSAIKKNEIMLSVETWMDLEIIILSKQSKSDKHKYNMISHMWNLKNDKKKNELTVKTERFPDIENKLMVTKGERRGVIN